MRKCIKTTHNIMIHSCETGTLNACNLKWGNQTLCISLCLKNHKVHVIVPGAATEVIACPFLVVIRSSSFL